MAHADTPQYRRDYERGWRYSRRSDNPTLDHLDNTGAPEAAYDGYLDAAASRPKWHLRDCDGCPEHPAEAPGLVRAPGTGENGLGRLYWRAADNRPYILGHRLASFTATEAVAEDGTRFARVAAGTFGWKLAEFPCPAVHPEHGAPCIAVEHDEGDHRDEHGCTWPNDAGRPGCGLVGTPADREFQGDTADHYPPAEIAPGF